MGERQGNCTCWPAGGPPCPEHRTIRRNPHHEHQVGHGDYADVECCICSDNPCAAVTVEAMRTHRWYDLEHERWRAGNVAEDAPF